MSPTCCGSFCASISCWRRRSYTRYRRFRSFTARDPLGCGAMRPTRRVAPLPCRAREISPPRPAHDRPPRAPAGLDPGIQARQLATGARQELHGLETPAHDDFIESIRMSGIFPCGIHTVAQVVQGETHLAYQPQEFLATPWQDFVAKLQENRAPSGQRRLDLIQGDANHRCGGRALSRARVTNQRRGSPAP